MANYGVTDIELINVANSIREKTGITETLNWPTDYIDAINNFGFNANNNEHIFFN